MRGSESAIAADGIGVVTMLIFIVVAVIVALLLAGPAAAWLRRRMRVTPHRQYDIAQPSDGPVPELD